MIISSNKKNKELLTSTQIWFIYFKKSYINTQHTLSFKLAFPRTETHTFHKGQENGSVQSLKLSGASTFIYQACAALRVEETALKTLTEVTDEILLSGNSLPIAS